LAQSGIEAPPIGGYFGRLMDFAKRKPVGEGVRSSATR